MTEHDDRDRERRDDLPEGATRDRNEREFRADEIADPGAKNPPHTTTGKVTSPKFGSAGSGGLEYEGPLKKD
jgi:hypothetical protein